MKRVSEYWHPEQSSLSINRKRDVRVIADAVLHTAKVNEAAEPIDMPRLPRFNYPKSLADANLDILEFNREETPFVVHALAMYTRELSGHSILAHRAQTLIGCLIVQAGGSFVPVESV